MARHYLADGRVTIVQSTPVAAVDGGAYYLYEFDSFL